jgi:hypothetical protein
MRIRDGNNSDPGSGMRDGNKSDPGSGMEKSRIRDKHPGSATLLLITIRYLLVIFIYLQKHNAKVLFTCKPEFLNLYVPYLVGSRHANGRVPTIRKGTDKVHIRNPIQKLEHAQKN